MGEDSVDKRSAGPLLLPGPSERATTEQEGFNFPFEPRYDLLRLDQVLTWIHSLPQPTGEESQRITEEIEGRLGKIPPYASRHGQAVPEDTRLANLHYAELLRGNLQETLSLAIRCFNYNPLVSPEEDGEIRVAVKQAIEAGRLEAVDAVLAFFDNFCYQRYLQSREQYAKRDRGFNVYDSESLSPVEVRMMREMGFDYQGVMTARRLAHGWQVSLQNEREKIFYLRKAIRQFYPPSEEFLIEKGEDKRMENYPWQKLAAQLKGESPEIQQALIALGIKPTDNPQEIKKAYQMAVKVAHPDYGGSAATLEDVRRAYRVALVFVNARLLGNNFFKISQ